MAITWGPVHNHERVGIDYVVTSESATSISFESRFYAGVVKWRFLDNQTLTISGLYSEAVNFYFDTASAGVGGTTHRHVRTRKHTYTKAYGGGPTVSLTGKISGAYNGAAPSHSRSFTIPARKVTAPSAPRSLSRGAIGATAITYSYQAPANTNGGPILEYHIEVTGGSTVNRYTTALSANVIGLISGKAYRARVRARNSAGWGGWTGYTAYSNTLAIPSGVGTPSASAITGTSVTHGWSAPSSNGGSAITGYQLQIATATNFSGIVYDKTENNRTRSISTLGIGRAYHTRVRPINAVGPGPWSGTRTFSTLNIPSPPKIPEQTDLGPDTVAIKWTAPGNGGSAITSYRVEVARSANFTTDLRTETTTATSLVIRDLTPGTTYYIRVRAINAIGVGTPSPALSITTLSGAKVRVGADWVNAIAYVRVGDEWVLARVHKRVSGQWVL